MTKYEQFDQALLTQIAAGKNTMMTLDSVGSGLRPLAKPFCEGTRVSEYRIIDRRLQALRKAGKIAYSGKVWVASK